MHILIVDDIEQNRVLLERFLIRQEYNVTTASSGGEAIALFEKTAFDLVLMDIKMPDMDGLEATRQLKALRPTIYTPIIFVTAISELEAFEDAIAAGGDDYITKPVSFGILASKIKAHARIRELNTEINKKNIELSIHNSRLKREHSLISHFFNQARRHCYLDENILNIYSSAMTMFNGDTVLTARKPNGGVNVLIGDFTGHGLSAAVGTLPVSQIFFQMSEENAFIGDIAREINRQINYLLPTEMFLAASLIELSASGERLMIWHGGMPDAYILNTETKELTTITSQHLPIGVRQTEEFNDDTELFYVNEKHKLIVCTDGLSEAIDTSHKMIDIEVIKQTIIDSESIIDGLTSCYQTYTKGMPQTDDISMLELSCKPTEKRHDTQLPDLCITVPWEINVTLNNQELQKDCITSLMEMMSGNEIIKHHKGLIHTLIAEMYTNALDHGLLALQGNEKDSTEAFDDFYKERDRRLQQLEDSWIKVQVKYIPTGDAAELMMMVHHNGVPFDIDPEHKDDEAGQDDLYGRGIMLIESLAEKVSYSDKGRCLQVVYQLL